MLTCHFVRRHPEKGDKCPSGESHRRDLAGSKLGELKFLPKAKPDIAIECHGQADERDTKLSLGPATHTHRGTAKYSSSVFSRFVTQTLNRHHERFSLISCKRIACGIWLPLLVRKREIEKAKINKRGS